MTDSLFSLIKKFIPENLGSWSSVHGSWFYGIYVVVCV